MIRVIIDDDGFIKDKAVVDNRREQKQDELRLLINLNPLKIEREVFEKTKEEKYFLKKLKSVVCNRLTVKTYNEFSQLKSIK